MNIEHQFQIEKGLFTAFVDTHRAGEMAYHVDKDKIVVDHTMVKSKYRNNGVGTHLFLQGLIVYLKNNNLKVVSHCSFVNEMFLKYPEYSPYIALE